jgi:hypothetical protein
MEIAAFCERYKLGDDICQLFVTKALDPRACLFKMNVNDKPKDILTPTYMAGIRLAVKKMLSETNSTIRVIPSKEENETGANGTQPPIFRLQVSFSTLL